MKKYLITLTLLLFLSTVNQSYAQDYLARMNQLVQLSEYEIQFDIQIKNNRLDPAGTGAWAYNSSQFQININLDLLNGGQLLNTFLNVSNSSSDLPVNQQLSNGDFFYSSVNTALASNSPSTSTDDELLLLNNDSWQTVATFNVKLRNSNNSGFVTWNEILPVFSFRFNDVIITTVDFYMDGGTARRGTAPGQAANSYALSKFPSDLLIEIPSCKFAAYVFTGEGDYQNPNHWNQAMKLYDPGYIQTVPGPTNNARISGIATITDYRSIAEITVCNGSQLVINSAAALTADSIFNRNSGLSSSGEINVASWDFEDFTQTVFPYLADEGNALNNGIALFTGVDAGNQLALIDDNGNRVAKGNIYIGGGAQYWQVQVNSTGMKDLKFSFMQKNIGSISDFKIQWSVDGIVFTDIISAVYSVGTAWTAVNELLLPSDLYNQETVYLRIVPVVSHFNDNYIDAVSVIGTAIPSGILVESNQSGTGSLIHFNAEVEVSIEYCVGPGKYVLSSPLNAQLIDPAFTMASATSYDFLTWYEPLNDWVSYKNTTLAPTWLDANENSLGFISGKGYLAEYDSVQTKQFHGYVNVEDINISSLSASGTSVNGRHWNLLGNPYASAIEWYTGWNVTNVGGVALVWNKEGKSYTPVNTGESILHEQGFMVAVLDASASLIIPEANRLHDTINSSISQAYPMLKLYVKDLDSFSYQESQVHINPLSTMNYDLAYDCDFFSGSAPQFFSIMGNDSLCVNSIPSFNELTIIPFAFAKSEGINFEFIAEGLGTFVETIYLYDKKTNIDHNLSINPGFNFVSELGDDVDRFELHFINNIVGAELPYNTITPKIYISRKHIHICTGNDQRKQVRIYNIYGQQIYHLQSFTQDIVIDLSSAAKGVYLISILDVNSSFRKKVLID